MRLYAIQLLFAHCCLKFGKVNLCIGLAITRNPKSHSSNYVKPLIRRKINKTATQRYLTFFILTSRDKRLAMPFTIYTTGTPQTSFIIIKQKVLNIWKISSFKFRALLLRHCVFFGRKLKRWHCITLAFDFCYLKKYAKKHLNQFL